MRSIYQNVFKLILSRMECQTSSKQFGPRPGLTLPDLGPNRLQGYWQLILNDIELISDRNKF